MGQDYSTICAHAQLKIQKMRGDGVQMNEYAKFICPDCHMNCFRYRRVNSFFDSSWKSWQPRNVESYICVGEEKFLGACNFKLCDHLGMSHQAAKGNTGQGMLEQANMKCDECGLNQKYERELGRLFDGQWQKAGTLLKAEN